MSVPLHYYLLLSAALFCVGVLGMLIRRNALILLMSVELILNAANLMFIAFAKYRQDSVGHLFALFIIAMAAAEAAVGLAIVLNVFRSHPSVDVDRITRLKG